MPNKAEFIDMLAQRLDGDRKKASAALDAVIDTVYHQVAKGEKVVLTGFGAFERRARAARLARNPATGAQVRVKKTTVPAFKAGAKFRAIVSGQEKAPKAPPAKKATAATKTTAKKTAAAKKTTTAAKKTTTARKTTAKKAPAKKAAAKKTTG